VVPLVGSSLLALGACGKKVEMITLVERARALDDAVKPVFACL
jgi:hypothetical protein